MINKKIYCLTILTSSLLFTSTCMALDLFNFDNVNPYNNWHPILTIGGGKSSSTSSNTGAAYPVLDPETDEFYVYSSSKNSSKPAVIDAFMAVESPNCSNWIFQLGLGYNQAGNFLLKGTFLQGADAQSADLYNYKYTVMARQVLAEGRILYQIAHRFYPYLMLAGAVNANRAYGYQTSIPPFTTFTRLPHQNLQASIGYNLGVGFDMALNDFIRLGVGYRFVDFGEVKFGKTTINSTTYSTTLPSFNLNANEYIAQLTFL